MEGVSRLFGGRKLSELPSSRSDARAAGARHYFVGAPCANGHLAPKQTSNSQCVECSRVRRIANVEAVREQGRRWARDNKAVNAAWKAANPAKIAEIKKRWKLANKDKMRAAERAAYAASPDKFHAWNHAKRARRRNAEGVHTADDIAVIRKAQRDRCANPACRVRLKGRGHIDHIVALSNGGSNWPSNLQLLCQHCNCSKHTRDPVEFMQDQGFLI